MIIVLGKLNSSLPAGTLQLTRMRLGLEIGGYGSTGSFLIGRCSSGRHAVEQRI